MFLPGRALAVVLCTGARVLLLAAGGDASMCPGDKGGVTVGWASAVREAA